ncbi:hypothetical protein [Halomonas sp. RA08-2]|uniref:hypothetical protein n=1 Tax=Halomonas sp. RA08-2 TaxID=3440842 RepID=UPI003EE8E237
MDEQTTADPIDCAALWYAALWTYYRDALRNAQGIREHGDEGEAWLDLTTGRELLANLCGPVDADPDLIGDGMLEAIREEIRKRGRQAAA